VFNWWGELPWWLFRLLQQQQRVRRGAPGLTGPTRVPIERRSS
jgi:hypothetical protein